jgi:bis(5'-nucleosidyl)-tetraphosphatase
MSSPSRQDRSYGIIPYFEDVAGRRYLLIRHRAGHWDFPKGHAEENEEPLEAARRELKEEAGVDLADLQEAPSYLTHYSFTDRRTGGSVEKTVTYYIGRVANPQEARVQPEEIAEYRWEKREAAESLLTYQQSRELLRQADAFLSEAAVPTPN